MRLTSSCTRPDPDLNYFSTGSYGRVMMGARGMGGGGQSAVTKGGIVRV